jgi:hypothetical protein
MKFILIGGIIVITLVSIGVKKELESFSASSSRENLKAKRVLEELQKDLKKNLNN